MKAGISGAFIILFSAAVFIYAGEGTRAGVTFSQPVGARPSSMAQAYTSMGDDASSLHYNPAGIAMMEHGELSVLYQSGIVDDSFGIVNFAVPLETLTLGMSFIYYSAGDIELISETGIFRELKAQEDIAAVLVLSRKLGEYTSAGIGLKMLHSTIVEEFTATAFASDIGWLWSPAERLRIGLSVRNVGTGLKYDTEREALSSDIRGGVSYDAIKDLFRHLTVSADIVRPSEGVIEKSAGFEYSLKNRYSLRCGIRDASDRVEISAGFGVSIRNIKIDYAWIPDDDLSSSHKLSVSAIWKSKALKEREKALMEPGLIMLNGHFAEAMHLFNNGKYKAAEKEWKLIIKIIPHHSKSKKYIRICREKIYGEMSSGKKLRLAKKYYKKGKTLLKQKKYAEAADYFEKVTILNEKVTILNPEFEQVKEFLKKANDGLNEKN